MAQAMGLTVRQLDSLRPGCWVSDGGQRGAGVLAARKLARQGICFYYRYVDGGGKRDALPIGQYDRYGAHGITLADARAKAGELSRRYMAGQRDLRIVLDSESRLARLAEEEAQRKHEQLHAATLGALIEAYVSQLEADEKVSAREVGAATRLHIERPWPMIWEKPAVEITTSELLAVIARVVEQGKRREADKLRAAIRAAYGAAIRSHQDASYSQALRRLAIQVNPARDLAVVKGSRKVRDRALSLSELQAYWNRIRTLDVPYGPLLRFHLLTGGQRLDQLQRVVMADYDQAEGFIVIRDIKGRREQARVHVVPLLSEAVEDLNMMRGGEFGDFLFTISRGRRGASSWTVRDALKPVVHQMLEAGELLGGVFTPGALRATVETRLAAGKVPKEVRGHLQSHGLAGVQDRHYDKHDYFDEKLSALRLLHKILRGEIG